MSTRTVLASRCMRKRRRAICFLRNFPKSAQFQPLLSKPSIR